MRPRGEGDAPGTGLYLAAALVGTLTGLVGGAFHALLDAAERGRSLLIAALADSQVPGWLVLMVLGPLVLIPAQWLVRRLAPETAGSGIPEVEAVLAGRRAVRWRRVLPVKFLAGALAVGSGLVLGREGPTVHLGSALGQMAADGARYGPRHARTLVAAGAAAGLAAAFNAPLAAIVFVTEELREHFEYGFASVQAVILAACLAVVASGWMLGQGPALPVQDLPMAPLASLPLFLLLGVLVGVLGVIFNGLLLGSTRVFQQLRADHAYGVTAAAGLVLGALLWWSPQSVGGGETLVESLIHQPPGVLALILLLAARTLTSVGSYGLGLPGGIFAPMLALGTIAGTAFDLSMQGLLPALGLSPGLFAVAAMGALFAATVRAPLTGIVLTVELTGALDLVLPITLTCLSATFAAEALGGRPVYGLLLALGDQPHPPMPRPRRRVLVPALGLAALVVIGRSAPWPRAILDRPGTRF
jgi:H+/Cl- antiporter ClcA